MKALSDLRQKYRRLTLRRKSQGLTELCNSHFEFPTSRTTIKRKCSQKLKRVRRRSIYYEQKSQMYRKVANELSKELYSSKLKVDSLQVQLSVLERKVGSLCTRNVHKREKRSATKLAKQKKEIDEQKGKMDTLRTENAALKHALQNEAKKKS
jgi:uncharacterized coiled-coil protein SlyX